jgi:hypothetical protein
MQVFVEREISRTVCMFCFEGTDVPRRVNCVEATVKPSAELQRRERSWHVATYLPSTSSTG